ncbi:MAG TPA: ROK family protein [Polyangiaceae bacterium]|nr:ROK family protein [Polyangiaceae bacterium]
MMQAVQGKVDSRSMREINRSIVLDIIRRGGRVSRTDLARRSALTKPTVSAIVEELLARGIVQEVGYGKALGSGGRRARLLEFNDASAAYLGLRYSATTTQIGIADARGTLRAVRELSHPHGDAHVSADPEARILETLSCLDEVLNEASVPRDRLQSVGVTVSGLVSQADGIVENAPNLGWHKVPVKDIVSRALGLPVAISNDVHGSALAEARCGAARGARGFVWVYVGTGVGSGIVHGGELFHGCSGYSGEIGHCPVLVEGPECSCGRRGCLEAVASGWAIARDATRAVQSGERTALADVAGPLDARTVSALAVEGDEVARRILTQVGTYVGIGISTLVNLFDPELIVLGGKVMLGGDWIVQAARESLAKHTVRRDEVRIVTSSLGDQVGLLGALMNAMDLSVRSYRVVATGERVA